MGTQHSQWFEVRGPRRIRAVYGAVGVVISSGFGGLWLCSQTFDPTVTQSLAVMLAFGVLGMVVSSFVADALIGAGPGTRSRTESGEDCGALAP